MRRVPSTRMARWITGGLLPLATVTAVLARGPVNATSPEPRQEFLLLRNHNVIHGIVRRDGDRFHVQFPHGVIQVRAAAVQRRAASLDAIYHWQRGVITAGDPAGHLQLAEWCIQNGLLGYAAREIMAGQDIDPDYPPLRAVEQRLDALARPPLHTAVRKTGRRTARRRSKSPPRPLRKRRIRTTASRSAVRRGVIHADHRDLARPADRTKRPVGKKRQDPFDPQTFNGRFSTSHPQAAATGQRR